MAHYNLIFQGEIITGASLDEVKNNVAKLFKADATKTAALFSGKPIVIKKNLDTESAKKYLTVLKKAGAIVKAVKIETQSTLQEQEKIPTTQAAPEDSTTTAPPTGLSAGLASLVNYNQPVTGSKPATAAAVPEPEPSSDDNNEANSTKKETTAVETTSGLQLAPVNEGVLTPSKAAEHIEIPDITHLTMSEAESGSLEEFAKKIEPVELPDIGELTMSEANSGSLEGIEIKPEPLELPDISELDMAELNDTPLSSDSPKPKVTEIPDISNLTMSDAQEGSLEGLEVKPEPAEIPDISHLEVEKTEEKPTNEGKAAFKID